LPRVKELHSLRVPDAAGWHAEELAAEQRALLERSLQMV
jgi:hypothetical protein